MAEQDSAPRIDLDQVVRIVSSYVQHHEIAPDQVLTLSSTCIVPLPVFGVPRRCKSR